MLIWDNYWMCLNKREPLYNYRNIKSKKVIFNIATFAIGKKTKVNILHYLVAVVFYVNISVSVRVGMPIKYKQIWLMQKVSDYTPHQKSIHNSYRGKGCSQIDVLASFPRKSWRIRQKPIALEPRLATRKFAKCKLKCAPNSKRILFRFYGVACRPRCFSVNFNAELVVCSVIIIAGLYTTILIL